MRRQYGARWDAHGRQCASHYGVNYGQGYVAFFHQFLGFNNNPALAPFANVPCRCTRYLMGSDGAWDHVSSCLQHASNWTCAHDHVWRALESICNEPVSPPITSGFSRVRATAAPISKSATSAWRSRPICLVDVTLPNDFIGAGHIGQNQGQLRNPDNLDHIFESAAADKIRNHRDPYRRNRHVAFLPACISTSGRIHGEVLRLIFFLSNKEGTYHTRLFRGASTNDMKKYDGPSRS
jgi:hypothetical protein